MVSTDRCLRAARYLGSREGVLGIREMGCMLRFPDLRCSRRLVIDGDESSLTKQYSLRSQMETHSTVFVVAHKFRERG